MNKEVLRVIYNYICNKPIYMGDGIVVIQCWTHVNPHEVFYYVRHIEIFLGDSLIANITNLPELTKVNTCLNRNYYSYSVAKIIEMFKDG